MLEAKVVGKIKTHFELITFFSESSTVYELMWQNIVEP
jgi:hypothetical protein